MKTSIAVIAMAVSGCQAFHKPEPQIVTIREPIEVKVAVPVPCVADIPQQPPSIEDDELLAMNDYQLVVALRREVLVLRAYVAELQAILAVCRAAAPL